MIGIEDLEGLGVHFEPLHGTVEHSPHFPVEFGQMTNVFTALDFDTGDAAQAAEFPIIGIAFIGKEGKFERLDHKINSD